MYINFLYYIITHPIIFSFDLLLSSVFHTVLSYRAYVDWVIYSLVNWYIFEVFPGQSLRLSLNWTLPTNMLSGFIHSTLLRLHYVCNINLKYPCNPCKSVIIIPCIRLKVKQVSEAQSAYKNKITKLSQKIILVMKIYLHIVKIY